MATDVGQLPPLPGDGCDVEQINDEEVLRRMWLAAEDFGRKKEIRARMYKLRERRLRDFYTTGEVLKDVQSADPHATIREETPKRGGTTYRQLVVGELRAGDQQLFEMRDKQTPAALHTTELIQTTTCTDSSDAFLDSRTTTTVYQETTVVQSAFEMLDAARPCSRQKASPTREVSGRKSASPAKDVSSRRSSTTDAPKEVSSRRSSTAEVAKDASSRRSSTSEVPKEVSSRRSSTSSRRSSLTKSPTRDASSRMSSSSETRQSVSPVRKSSVSETNKEVSSSRRSSATAESTKEVSSRIMTVSSSPTSDVSIRISSSSSRGSVSPAKEVSLHSAESTKQVSSHFSSVSMTSSSSEIRESVSPAKEVSGRKSSITESSSRRSSISESAKEVTSRLYKTPSPTRDWESSTSPVRDVSSRKSSVGSSPSRDADSMARKSSTSSCEIRVGSPTKDASDGEVQYSSFTSVTLVKQQDGSRVTSPNRRKLSSATSKARRAGTPSASPPRSPNREKEVPEETIELEQTTVKDIKSRFEEVSSKPKSILRTPDRKKSAIETIEAQQTQQQVAEITLQVTPEPVQEVKVESQIKRAVAEVKLESTKKTEVTKSVENKQTTLEKKSSASKIDAKEFQKEARASSIRRRSREQVEDSSDRDSSCSPVRTRTHSKSKVVQPKETTHTTSTTTTTVTSTATLKRPTKLPMLNNKKAEDRCCNRKHGASSPEKPWRQSPMQSPKKATAPSSVGKTPTKAPANRSPSSSPERAAPVVESRIARRPVVQKSPAVISPTKRTPAESPLRRPITDRASTTHCTKPQEKPAVSRIASRSATSPIKPEPSRFQRKPAEATSPVKRPAESVGRKVPESTTPARRAIPTYQRPQQQTARTTTTTTSSLRQTTQQQKTTVLKNGRSLSGSKLVEPKVQKESPKVVAAPKQILAPSVKVSKPVESEEEESAGGFSTEEDETVTELEDIRYSSANLLDTEDEERGGGSARRHMEVRQTQIQQLSRDSSPDGRPQRFADRVSEPESDFESAKRERTPLEVVVPPGGLDGLQEEQEDDEDDAAEEPALLSVADKASIFLTTDLSKVEKRAQVFETNRAVSLAKAVFERKDEDQLQQQQQLEEARKKYERDILSRPSVFSKLNERIKSLDLPEEGAKEPVQEQPIAPTKVAPLCSTDEPVAAPAAAPVAAPAAAPAAAPEEPKAVLSRASGKFGVTLRRTSSRLSDVAAPKDDAPEPKVAAPAAAPVTTPVTAPTKAPVEDAVNVKQLEIMLEKATDYDERRRLRAAIRDAKKTQTIFTTTTSTKVTTNFTKKSTSPTRQQVNGRRSASPAKQERKNSSPSRAATRQPAETRQEEDDGNSMSTPVRAAPAASAPAPLAKQPSSGKLDKGKFATFERNDSAANVVDAALKRKTSSDNNSSVRKVSSGRDVNPTDSVTSSYGVGPIDETGRPLFGLRALRRTQDAAPAPVENSVVEETPKAAAKPEVTDVSGRPLFGGLRALKKGAVVQRKESVASESEDFLDSSAEDATMPERPPSSGQLKSLVERHEQSTTKVTSSSVGSGGQKPKAKLRDTFVTQESRTKLVAEAHKASKTEALVNRSERANSLKAIINKHETTSTAASAVPAAVEAVRKVSTDQVKSILKKPREATPEATVVSSAAICLRRESTERRPDDIEQESTIEDEDGNKTVVKNVHRERQDGNTSATFSGTSRVQTSGDGSRTSSHTSTSTTVLTKGEPLNLARVGRSGSVRALQQRFQQSTVERSSAEPRAFQKAGLIFRTNSFKNALAADKNLGDNKEVCEERAQRTERVTESEGSVERRVTETRVVSAENSSSSTTTSRSFLGNSAKVTGVQDVLTRMREADHDHEEGVSADDREAKALLNKFLGASVLMQGIEPLLQAQSPALVSQVEKQRLAIAQEEKPCGAAGDVESVTDQAHLRQLLDASNDYDTRRQIRARLRTLMADNKVSDGSDAVADGASRSIHGELLPLAVDQLMATLENNFPVVNIGGGDVGDGDDALGNLQEYDGPAVDSGTESGEDPRTPNSQSQLDLAPLAPQLPPKAELPPELLDEVLGALSKLQGSLQMAAGEDVEPERREAILALVSRLQGSLPVTEKAPPLPVPRKKKLSARHTVGVSGDDLEDARRLVDGAKDVPFSPLRPSDFNARVGKEENFEVYDPITALTLKRPLHKRSFSQGAQRKSISDDPSTILFSPEQNVQIAIHKAAINKQLSQEEDNRRNQALLPSEREGSVEAELNFSNINGFGNKSLPEAKLEFDFKTLPEAEKPKPFLRTKSLDDGPKPLSLFSPPLALKAPEIVKTQVKAAVPEKPKQQAAEPNPVVQTKQPLKQEVPRPVFPPKSEPISKPIFAASDHPRPVFSKQDVPKPVAKPKPEPVKQQEQPRADLPKPYAAPSSFAKVPPVEPARVNVPKLPETSLVSDIKTSKLQFLEAEPEVTEPVSGVIWGSILQSSKDGDKKYLNRAEKKRKIKRANTIDIPKPFDMQNVQDSEDEDFDTDSQNSYGQSQRASLEVPFVPKTENDRKFLAFLERTSPNTNGRPSSAAGLQHWNSRFSNLKTNFEKRDDKEEPKIKPQEPAKPMWSKKPEEPVIKRPCSVGKEGYEQKRKSSLPSINTKKDALPWAANEGHVVVGSLTVMQNQNVQNKKQMFSKAPVEPKVVLPDARPPISKPMPPMIKSVEPAPTTQQLMELQRQQQQRYMQQKEEQERYRLQRKQRQEAERERIRGPAPSGSFNHAHNSAFRPIPKRSMEPAPVAEAPKAMFSASVATETRQLNMRIFGKADDAPEDPEDDILQEVAAPLTLMTAVSRVKEGPRCQQATLTQGQVQRRDSPSRSQLAKSHLRSLLPAHDDDPITPPGSCVTRSSRSTSDMHDLSFQARYDASATSSRCSSSLPRPFDSPPPPDEVLSMKLEFPLHQQASPLPFSPPTQRRTLLPAPPKHESPLPLRKCESWHQIGRPQNLLSVPASPPPLRRSPSGAKIHLFSKQYEAQVSPDRVEDKQRQMLAYLGHESPPKSPRPFHPPAYLRQDTLRGIVHDDDLQNVDEEFERLFESSVRPVAPRLQRRGDAVSSVRLTHSVPSSPTAGKRSEFTMKSSSSTSTIQLDGGTKISSVSSTMTSNTRVSKAPPSKLKMSPFDKFRQLDEQNSSPSPSTPKTPGGSNSSAPLFKFTDAGLNRSASNVKERLLYWCQVKTKEYKDLKIENFSTSWNNGMAFCALIHHFCPDAFNYEDLRPEERRKNFTLAFRVADEKADIAPLLDVEDMVVMKKPDWKCVFTYVQSIYRRFKDED